MCVLSKSYGNVIKRKTPNDNISLGAIFLLMKKCYFTTIFLVETVLPEVIETKYIPF